MQDKWWTKVKPEHWLKMASKDWEKTPKDYKDVKPDGTKIIMHLGPHGTTLSPVMIIDNVERGELDKNTTWSYRHGQFYCWCRARNL